MKFKPIETPLGVVRVFCENGALIAALLPGEREGRVRLAQTYELASRDRLLDEAERQLKQFFKGTRQKFKLPFAPKGTLFQLAVWKELEKISYGSTLSYADVAMRIGRPKASRAVGAAIGRNPLCIFVPCHRVVGSSGKLTGFAGGLAAKDALLKLEFMTQAR